ncbi:MAG: response regulator, partial [Elusimicrobiota bacterium]
MAEGPGKRLLLVDTDETAARALSSFLESHGYRTRTVTDYRQAITAVQNWKPDLVILNILLQTFNTLDFISEIRKNPFTVEQRIIIFSQTPATGIVTGPSPRVCGYLTKPADFEALKVLLHKIAPQQRRRQTIMVADDDAEFSDLLKMFLEANNYRALMVTDSLQVMERLRAEKPDALLLDIMMPGKDGFAIMEEMQESADTAEIPIIILSALRLENYQERGILTGLPEIFAREIPDDLLLRLIEEQTSSDGAYGEPQKASRPRVLLADDQTELLLLMKETVELAGFEVVTANDGVEAMTAVFETNPDIIVLDNNMPRRNGLEV